MSCWSTWVISSDDIVVLAAGGDGAISRFGGRLGPRESPAVGLDRTGTGEVIAIKPVSPPPMAVSPVAPLAMFSRYAVCGLLRPSVMFNCLLLIWYLVQ